MAWAEKTFFNVKDSTHDSTSESEDRINQMLKDLPPFMKLTSRKARKTLVRYEELKQRHIENLRDNDVFKFVMKVAGFTNERIEKYWKGSDISPFMEKYTPKNIKITKDDLDILKLRAREHALSDLHQFCTEVVAIPMYRPIQTGKGHMDRDKSVNIPDHSALPDPTVRVDVDAYKSKSKMIFNMSDSEFQVFCKKFLLMKKTLEKAYNGKNDIIWYTFLTPPDPEYVGSIYDHTAIFDSDEVQQGTYDDPLESVEIDTDDTNSHLWTWMDNTPIVHWDKTTAEFWFQRYIAKWLADDTPDRGERPGKDQFLDLTDFRDRFRTLFNNLRLDKSTGKWMRDLTGLRLTKMIRGRKEFKDRGVGLGKTTAMGKYRDEKDIDDKDTGDKGSDDPPPPSSNRQASTGTSGGVRTIRRLNNRDKSGIAVGVTNFEEPEVSEGDLDVWRPEDLPTEVPLDFVRPMFNERFAYWKHELVLGEYEKRSMQEADKWLQMTPWAIGKIYLQPSIYAHMQEAHIAITKKWKKFAHLTLEDWLSSSEHSFFYSKLVSLCIKTSDVLSGKKYGLDKMYMRLNLEKRRIMYSIGKLSVPGRTRKSIGTLPPTITEEKLWKEYQAARAKGDAAEAARVQFRMQRVPF